MRTPSPEPSATPEAALAQAQQAHGPDAQVQVRPVRSGGVLGFFTTEQYVAEVATDEGAAQPVHGTGADPDLDSALDDLQELFADQSPRPALRAVPAPTAPTTPPVPTAPVLSPDDTPGPTSTTVAQDPAPGLPSSPFVAALSRMSADVEVQQAVEAVAPTPVTAPPLDLAAALVRDRQQAPSPAPAPLAPRPDVFVTHRSDQPGGMLDRMATLPRTGSDQPGGLLDRMAALSRTGSEQPGGMLDRMAALSRTSTDQPGGMLDRMATLSCTGTDVEAQQAVEAMETVEAVEAVDSTPVTASPLNLAAALVRDRQQTPSPAPAPLAPRPDTFITHRFDEPGGLLDRLAALGVPHEIVPDGFTEDAADRGVHAALTRVLRMRLATVPIVTLTSGTVIVLGPGVEALTTAAALAPMWGIDPATVRWAAPADLSTLVPPSRRVATATDALEWITRPRRSAPVDVLAISAPLDRSRHGWATDLVGALDPDLVLSAVDATRHAEDAAAWLRAICTHPVNGVALHNVSLTQKPGAFLSTGGVPVVSLDGERATAARWASVLCERLAETDA